VLKASDTDYTDLLQPQPGSLSKKKRSGGNLTYSYVNMSGLCNRTGVIFVQLGNIHNLSDIILAVGIWDIQNCME
jgi:hypothetical protein